MRRRHPLRSLLLWLTLSAVCACDHAAEEARLLGYWEGLLPFPSSGETVPIAYQFRDDGLTVWVGLGPERVETSWVRWKVAGIQDGDLVVYIYRSDNRVFATQVRVVGEDQLLLWDSGMDMATAARVQRVEPPPSLRTPTDAHTLPDAPPSPDH